MIAGDGPPESKTTAAIMRAISRSHATPISCSDELRSPEVDALHAPAAEVTRQSRTESARMW
eukprot:scaffold287726_cov35-Tisochrysis_lutea.AAC.2